MGKVVFIRFYYCSLSSTFHPYPTEPSTPNTSLDISARQEGAYALAVCVLTGSTAHADRLSQHTLRLTKQDTCLLGPHRAELMPKQNTSLREGQALPLETIHPRPPRLYHHHSCVLLIPLHRVDSNA